MEHKISALFDLRIEMYRHALFRYYAIECDNFTNAMYYQLLYLDADSRFTELREQASSEEFERYILATFCSDCL
jgi:hypothetical protein